MRKDSIQGSTMQWAILYLLGAGASYEKLPLARDMAGKLRQLAGYLKSSPQVVNDFSTELTVAEWSDDRDLFLKNLEWLCQEASPHFTVDTYAKKLFFLRDYKSLKKLKATLSAALVVLQALAYPEVRYDAFFATILELDNDGRPVLPKHLRILTWNYDIQLEKAFYGFCEDEGHVVKTITFNEQVFRINGSCGTHPPGHVGESFTGVWNSTSSKGWEWGIKLFAEYMSSSSSPESEISFAWEDSTKSKIMKSQIEMLEVPAVVIIGYSFPYFNREIDKIIFNTLSDCGLKRIYLQLPEHDHESVEERIKPLLMKKDVEIVRKVSLDQFYIPDEFWET